MTEILLATILLTAIVLALTAAVTGARRIMLPSRPVTVTVNGTRRIEGTTGQRLLSILQDDGIPVPSGCAGAGTCGLCRVRLTDGGGAALPTETARITRADIRDGFRLACQVVVRAPVDVAVPDEMLSAETMTCTVASSRMLAPLIREIILETPEDTQFQPRAGAFVQIEAPPYDLRLDSFEVPAPFDAVWQQQGWRKLAVRNTAPVTRAYSLANTPADGGRAVLNLRLAVPPPGAGADIPPGLVSSWLFSLVPGDRVVLSGPYGDFGARDTGREMVLIGGGVGMAPLRSIIHEQLARTGASRKISYWYGARGLTDAFYTDEFRALEAEHPNFSFTLALSDPPDEVPPGVQTGFIHQVAHDQYLRDHPAPEDCEYYLCGPPLMIGAVRSMLDSLGVEEDAIFFDDFGG